ncbi:ribonuclease H-like domain-containing protein [Hyaloraphidium curvatum]|nr:ribonuclease H-like domain-containing protein [Hyaloraphidium curvatum]
MAGAEEAARAAGDDDAPSFDEYIDATCSKLVAATKAAAFVRPDEFAVQAASSREFASGMKAVGNRVLRLANKLLAYAGTASSDGSRRRKTPREYQDADDVLDRFGPVVDVLDDLLERADTAIDVHLGRRALPGSFGAAPQAEGATPSRDHGSPADVYSDSRSRNKAARLDPKLYNAAHLLRPQLRFEDEIDNDGSRPFRHKITDKPHAVVPLDVSAVSDPFFHAYQHEIGTVEYPDHVFEPAEDPSFVEDMSQTAFTWVDTVPALRNMLGKLERADEIAVDTENHSYRSFQGFICLIQISTREEDFVLDALALRPHLHTLNTVFANPRIVKILHGADMDVQWLQRDFGVYLVNLFDTYHASHVLQMPQHSYAYLLKFYCGIDADKKYQLADWRIRPVPAEMLAYARSDTHYLHYIYDRMKTELLRLAPDGSHQLLTATLERSAATALKVYAKETYDSTGGGANGWRKALEKHRGSLVPRQVAVFRRVHAWRDRVAREEDESTAYVMPAKLLGMIAEATPVDAHALAKICNPMPPLVRSRMTELLAEVKGALDDAARPSETVPSPTFRAKDEPEAMDMDGQDAEGEPEEPEGPTAAIDLAPEPSSVVPTKRTVEDIANEKATKPRRKVTVISKAVSAPGLVRRSTFFDGLDDIDSPRRSHIPAAFLSSSATPEPAQNEEPSPILPHVPSSTVDHVPEERDEVSLPSPKAGEMEARKPPKHDLESFQRDALSSAKKKKKAKTRSVEPFDYSAVPRPAALDAVLGDPSAKRERKEARFNIDEMDFEVLDEDRSKKIKKVAGDTEKKKVPAEPRAHLAPKSAMKTFTYTTSKKN